MKNAPIEIPANVRRLYTDKRTSEGKKLAAVQDSLINSVGGPDACTENVADVKTTFVLSCGSLVIRGALNAGTYS